jgi:hypothetical protein
MIQKEKLLFNYTIPEKSHEVIVKVGSADQGRGVLNVASPKMCTSMQVLSSWLTSKKGILKLIS